MQPSTDHGTPVVNSDNHPNQESQNVEPATAETPSSEKHATPKRSPFMDVCLAAGMENFFDRGRGMQLSHRRVIELQQELAAHPEIALISDQACTDLFWKEHGSLQESKLEDLRSFLKVLEKSVRNRSDANVHVEQLRSIISYLSKTRPEVSIMISKKQLLGLYRTKKVASKYAEVYNKLKSKQAAAGSTPAASAAAMGVLGTIADASRASVDSGGPLVKTASLPGTLSLFQKMDSLQSRPSDTLAPQPTDNAASTATVCCPSPEQSASTITPSPLPPPTLKTSSPLSHLSNSPSLSITQPPLNPGSIPSPTSISVCGPKLTTPQGSIPSPTSTAINSTLTVFSASNPPAPDWETNTCNNILRTQGSIPTPVATKDPLPSNSAPLEVGALPARPVPIQSPWQDVSLNLNMPRSMASHGVARPSLPRPIPHPASQYSAACNVMELERRSAALRASPFASMMGRYRRGGHRDAGDFNVEPIPGRNTPVPNPSTAPHLDPHVGSPTDSMLDDLLPSDMWPPISVSPTEAHLGDRVLASLGSPSPTDPPREEQVPSATCPHSPKPTTSPPPLQMLPRDKCLNLSDDQDAPLVTDAPCDKPRVSPVDGPLHGPAPLHGPEPVHGPSTVCGDDDVQDGRRSAVELDPLGYPDFAYDADFALFNSSTSIGRQFAACIAPSIDTELYGAAPVPLPDNLHAPVPPAWSHAELPPVRTHRRSSFEFEFMYGRVAVDRDSSEYPPMSPFEPLPDPRFDPRFAHGLGWQPPVPGMPGPGHRHRMHPGRQRMASFRMRRVPYPPHPRLPALPPAGHPAWSTYADMETESLPLTPRTAPQDCVTDWRLPGYPR